jgi:hypothetical protein
MTEATAEEPQAHATVDVEMETPTTPNSATEAAILVTEEECWYERRVWRDVLTWVFGVVIFFFFFVLIFAALQPDSPPQRTIVQLPDDSGLVLVAPGRRRYDRPRVVAVYRKEKPKVVVRERVIVREKPVPVLIDERAPVMAPTPTQNKPREKTVIKRSIPANV